MPKETIRVIHGANDVQVGWTRDCEVQVGVEDSEGRSLFWKFGDIHAEMIGSEVRRLVAEANEPGAAPLGDLGLGENVLNMLDTVCFPYSGVWSTMGRRQEVNELIRILRRARDSAFGKDA